jgi:hypothetical protein
MVGSSCSTSGARRVNLVKTRDKVMNEERPFECLPQVEHIRHHL